MGNNNTTLIHNCIDSNGDTPLIIACRRELESEAIKLIDNLGNKCKPDQVNNFGNTVLMYACTACFN